MIYNFLRLHLRSCRLSPAAVEKSFEGEKTFVRGVIRSILNVMACWGRVIATLVSTRDSNDIRPIFRRMKARLELLRGFKAPGRNLACLNIDLDVAFVLHWTALISPLFSRVVSSTPRRSHQKTISWSLVASGLVASAQV